MKLALLFWISFPIIAYSKLPRLDPVLVSAIVNVESKGSKKCSKRYEPNYRWVYEVASFAKKLRIPRVTELKGQKTSWGPMHVMGATARELGYLGNLSDLCEKALGMKFGMKKLSECLGTYRSHVPNALACYNAGSVRRDNSGKYVNQSYVDNVLSEMRKIKRKNSGLKLALAPREQQYDTL